MFGPPRSCFVVQCALAGLLVLALAGPGWPAVAGELTLDDIFQQHADGRQAEKLEFRPETDQLRYTWDDGEGEAVWLLDVSKNTVEKLFETADLGAEEADDLKDLQFSPDGGFLLYRLDDDLHLYELATGERRQLTTDETGGESPGFSPAGDRIALVRDEDLYVYDLATASERRLTTDGEPGVVFNGTTDWVYWEEIWGRSASGFWWSGNSRRLAFYHIDDRHLSVYPLVDTDSLVPEVEEQRYPKAGEALPKVEVRVFDLETGTDLRLDTGEDPDTYLARVHWHPDHQRLMVERLHRDQTRLDLLLCEATSGSCREINRETWPTWVNLGDEMTFLADGGFLWSSESSGWKQLYHHAPSGERIRRLTPEGWCLAELVAVEEDAGFFLFTAYATSELGAAERHVFVGFLDGSPAKRLTREPGWHRVLASSGESWAHAYGNANTPEVLTVRDLEGEQLAELPSIGPATFDPATLPLWEILTLPGPGGVRLPARLLKPEGFDPERRYPVVMYHYGGPASQVVENRWSRGRARSLWHKYLATQGYLVLSVDNEASNYFGKKGEDRLHRRFGELELSAQLAAVDYLRSLDFVDPERIGLWGWSGGGSNTLYSLLHRPGVWAAAISGAPVTHWHYYDAIWTERYFDHPEENAEGYEASSALNAAENLADPLLLIHGTGDDNVHPQNTYNLMDRLIRAGKPFEVAIYPNEGHGVGRNEPEIQKHLYARMTEFFDRHLRPGQEEPSSM